VSETPKNQNTTGTNLKHLWWNNHKPREYQQSTIN